MAVAELVEAAVWGKMKKVLQLSFGKTNFGILKILVVIV